MEMTRKELNESWLANYKLWNEADKFRIAALKEYTYWNNKCNYYGLEIIDIEEDKIKLELQELENESV